MQVDGSVIKFMEADHRRVRLSIKATCKRTQQLPTTHYHNNMQQSVQMDTTYNIQQCWDLLANAVASFCKGLKTKVYLFIYLFIIYLFMYKYRSIYTKRHF